MDELLKFFTQIPQNYAVIMLLLFFVTLPILFTKHASSKTGFSLITLGTIVGPIGTVSLFINRFIL